MKKEIKQIAKNKNSTAIDIGCLDKLMEHTYVHPKLGHVTEGRVFLKECLDATGTEISFNSIPPETDVPYFHIHFKNEETYVILRGSGYFQVDNDCFEIHEGSVIRVAPEGKRGLGNTSKDTMIYMVVQSKRGSLEEYTSDDGGRVEFSPKWR